MKVGKYRLRKYDIDNNRFEGFLKLGDIKNNEEIKSDIVDVYYTVFTIDWTKNEISWCNGKDTNKLLLKDFMDYILDDPLSIIAERVQS